MSSTSNGTLWTLGTGLATLAAATVTKNLLQRGWKTATGRKPPSNPAAAETGWGEAILWTIAVSVTAGLVKLVTKRQAGRFKAGDVPALHTK